MLDILKKTDIAIFEGRDLDLMIESYSNATRTIQVRGITENAQIIADHITNADRSLATSYVDITSIPITLTVKASTAGVKHGECYVKVSLRLEGVVIAIIGACYITDGATIQYPGGKIEGMLEGIGFIRSITGTDPAAGVEISETVPAGARWLLKGIKFPFVSDATVANRIVTLTITDGVNEILKLSSNYLQPATINGMYSFAGVGANSSVSGGAVVACMPFSILLSAGYKITTVTTNLQAGDNFGTPQLFIEEFITP